MSLENNKYTIGMDFGTLSARALLVDTKDGRVLGESVMDYPHGVIDEVLTAPGGDVPIKHGHAYQNPADYITVAEFIIHDVIKKSGIDKENVVGICIDFTACSILPVYEDGTPLCFDKKFERTPGAYVKLWKHHGAQDCADRLTKKAEEIGGYDRLKRFGGKFACEWVIPKILETIENDPDVYSSCRYIIESGDWLTWKLTGKLTKSYGLASYKALYVKEEGGYPSEDELAALDERLRHVVKDKLDAPVLEQGALAGRVTKEAAEEFGLPEGCAVTSPFIDAHIAFASLGMRKSGDMFAVLGTSNCYLLISDKYVPLPGICGVVKDGMLPGFYGYETGLCCGGDHFSWFADNLTPAEYKKEADERGISSLKLLIEKAAKQKPGEHGLLALNWWNGNRSILIDADLSGMFIGMSLRTKPEDMLRALIESTAYGTRVIIENFRKHGLEVSSIVAGGGIARKDPFTMQLYADVLGTDIKIAGTSQAGALGGAVIAAYTAGVYKTIPDAADVMTKLSDIVYHPRKEASEVYDRLFAEYLKLFDYFGRGENNVMKKLHAIRDGVCESAKPCQNDPEER